MNPLQKKVLSLDKFGVLGKAAIGRYSGEWQLSSRCAKTTTGGYDCSAQ